MRIQASAEIRAKPRQVFELYQDAAGWNRWDPEVAEAALPRGLAPGSTGWLKPIAGPRTRIRVIEVTQDRSFLVESRLPLCRMRFGHEVSERSDGSEVVHWVEFTGPLGFLFRRLIGNSFRESLPRTMHGLKQASEARTVAA